MKEYVKVFCTGIRTAEFSSTETLVYELDHRSDWEEDPNGGRRSAGRFALAAIPPM